MSSNWSSTIDFSNIPVGTPVTVWRALPAMSWALPARPPRAPPISGGTESVVSRSIAFIKGFRGVSGADRTRVISTSFVRSRFWMIVTSPMNWRQMRR